MKINFYRTGSFRNGNLVGINYAAVADYEPYFVGTRSAQNSLGYLLELGYQSLSPDWEEIKPQDVPLDVLLLIDDHWENKYELFKTFFPSIYQKIKEEKEAFENLPKSTSNLLFGDFFTKTEADLMKSGFYPFENAFSIISMDDYEPTYVTNVDLREDCLYSNITCYVENNHFCFSTIEYKPLKK